MTISPSSIPRRIPRRAVLSGLSAASALAFAPLPTALAQDGLLNVVATTGMIADTARRVGGDLVAVRSLMGPGIDPHGYRQTRSDVALMLRADLVLWNGLYLEAQMEEFLEGLARRTPVVAVAESLDPDRLLASDEYSERFDPHVWMAPPLWSAVVDAVADAIIEARPGSEEAIRRNAGTYKSELAALDGYASEAIASVPEPSRVLLTAHDAFGYLGREYGLEVLGIQGISTESETGLARIGELVDLLVERNIGAVFVESSVSDRNVRALIEGARARGHEVVIGGELFSDAMGPEGTYEGTYLGMIDHNVTTIARALGGTAPERGLLGRLGEGS